MIASHAEPDGEGELADDGSGIPGGQTQPQATRPRTKVTTIVRAAGRNRANMALDAINVVTARRGSK